MPRPRRTYARSGADPHGQKEAHKVLARRLETTFSTRKGKIGRPIFPIGHYAGLVDIGNGRVLSLHTDNVGTKILIAKMLGRYDTIGIDCVAMCANDLICTGAEPMSFLDYLAMSKPQPRIVREIAVGLVEGAREAGMAIVGGETAIVPDLLSEDGGLDLVGMAVGVCRRKDLILGDRVVEGDCIVGVASSGIHSNGFTLVRKILFKNHLLREKIAGFDRSLGEELLQPTRIYVRPVLEFIKSVEVHGLAHITGGGFSKIARVVGQAGQGASLDMLPEPPRIFQLIQKEGRVSDSEMYNTFNMGIGLVVICPAADADRIVRVFRKHRQVAMRIGWVEKKTGIRIDGKTLNKI